MTEILDVAMIFVVVCMCYWFSMRTNELEERISGLERKTFWK